MLFRSHHGVRGGGTAAFDASEMKSMWKESNKKIFTKIFQQKNLESYNFCKFKIFNKKIDNIAFVCTRILSQLSNGCFDNALADYNIINNELNQIKYQYNTLDEIVDKMPYLFILQNRISALLSKNDTGLAEENMKFILNLVDVYSNSVRGCIYNRYSKRNDYFSIMANPELLKYVFRRFIGKIKKNL